MREKLDPVYGCTGIPYSASFANEAVPKAVCIFRTTGGKAMKAAVNMSSH